MGKQFKHDVYVDIDQDKQANKLLARRGGGGGEVGRTMDKFEKYEFSEDIKEEDDSEIDDDEAFNDDDEEKYGIFFGKVHVFDGRSRGKTPRKVAKRSGVRMKESIWIFLISLVRLPKLPRERVFP
jgi:hypothetical protein